ncbi:hypothetical protein [Roseobacter sp. CCS2]|uniref:hypothetical protein n=1 Tax=Roseobacter sp. CCS2 TaxID=391593 RepID=UPI0000F3C540|nr:hypothetical protein [Roseobacter sp. CCS2]EBA11769.1 hypothetical protein RCCS2_17611 [Roseobacter sp. CCS2]
MNIDEKQHLSRIGDTSDEAIAFRLRAARRITGMQQKEFAAAIPIGATTYNTQEKKGRPSIPVMRYLYQQHRVDFNFIIHGDFAQLAGDVQDQLFSALNENVQSSDHQSS